jgi:hypothetical protein
MVTHDPSTNSLRDRALVSAVAVDRNMLRGFWCWVCAVDQGDFASAGGACPHSGITVELKQAVVLFVVLNFL